MPHDSQIVRMLNDINFAKKEQGGGDSGGVHGVDLCPAPLEKEIDAMNEFVYEKVSHAKVHSGGVFDGTCPGRQRFPLVCHHNPAG